MSGSGKSSAVEELRRRGFTAIDTDDDAWCEWVSSPEPDWIWREDVMARLLAEPRAAPLFLAGCKTNQGRFYDRLDHVVLLTAPLEVLLDRVARRTTNPYGRREEERAEIAHYVDTVEPLLRRRATDVWDTSALTVRDIADRLVNLVTP